MYPEDMILCISKGSQRGICIPMLIAALFAIAKGGSNPNVHLWMDMQNVVYTCNGILLGLKKEGNFDSC